MHSLTALSLSVLVLSSAANPWEESGICCSSSPRFSHPFSRCEHLTLDGRWEAFKSWVTENGGYVNSQLSFRSWSSDTCSASECYKDFSYRSKQMGGSMFYLGGRPRPAEVLFDIPYNLTLSGDFVRKHAPHIDQVLVDGSSQVWLSVCLAWIMRYRRNVLAPWADLLPDQVNYPFFWRIPFEARLQPTLAANLLKHTKARVMAGIRRIAAKVGGRRGVWMRKGADMSEIEMQRHLGVTIEEVFSAFVTVQSRSFGMDVDVELDPLNVRYQKSKLSIPFGFDLMNHSPQVHSHIQNEEAQKRSFFWLEEAIYESPSSSAENEKTKLPGSSSDADEGGDEHLNEHQVVPPVEVYNNYGQQGAFSKFLHYGFSSWGGDQELFVVRRELINPVYEGSSYTLPVSAFAQTYTKGDHFYVPIPGGPSRGMRVEGSSSDLQRKALLRSLKRRSFGNLVLAPWVTFMPLPADGAQLDLSLDQRRSLLFSLLPQEAMGTKFKELAWVLTTCPLKKREPRGDKRGTLGLFLEALQGNPTSGRTLASFFEEAEEGGGEEDWWKKVDIEVEEFPVGDSDQIGTHFMDEGVCTGEPEEQIEEEEGPSEGGEVEDDVEDFIDEWDVQPGSTGDSHDENTEHNLNNAGEEETFPLVSPVGVSTPEPVGKVVSLDSDLRSYTEFLTLSGLAHACQLQSQKLGSIWKAIQDWVTLRNSVRVAEMYGGTIYSSWLAFRRSGNSEGISHEEFVLSYRVPAFDLRPYLKALRLAEEVPFASSGLLKITRIILKAVVDRPKTSLFQVGEEVDSRMKALPLRRLSVPLQSLNLNFPTKQRSRSKDVARSLLSELSTAASGLLCRSSSVSLGVFPCSDNGDEKIVSGSEEGGSSVLEPLSESLLSILSEEDDLKEEEILWNLADHPEWIKQLKREEEAAKLKLQVAFLLRQKCLFWAEQSVKGAKKDRFTLKMMGPRGTGRQVGNVNIQALLSEWIESMKDVVRVNNSAGRER